LQRTTVSVNNIRKSREVWLRELKIIVVQILMVGDAGIGAVGGDADDALQVGSPQSGTMPAVAVHYLRVGVMEHISL